MDENFLLNNETAVKLYNDFAKDMPIIDYHCHLSPKEIFENKRFKNITEAWLYGDHYKWRAMRSNGVDEKYITGDGSDYEKFMAWARTIPMTIGNPLYHWTHLELQRYFGIYEILNEKTAPMIWEKANKLIQGEGFSARDLISKSNVKALCTTDDLIDSLKYHIELKKDKNFKVKVLPAVRPDGVFNIKKETFIPWTESLSKVCNKDIKTFDEFLKGIEERVEFFHSVGCRVSDHGFDTINYIETSKEEAEAIFNKALNKEKLKDEEEIKYQTYMINFLGKLYAKLGWVMQLHIGALRNNNTKMFKKLGKDTGFDSIDDNKVAYPVSKILDSLDREGCLPKTILYTLNPKDNYVLASMIGNFQGTEVPGKVQFGAAWWFLDNKEGMISQMKSLANVGLLTRFVGMLTDSRSFISYPRHEYFRRILCNLLGKWVEDGEVPLDMELLGKVVKGICFDNANTYFGFDC